MDWLSGNPVEPQAPIHNAPIEAPYEKKERASVVVTTIAWIYHENQAKLRKHLSVIQSFAFLPLLCGTLLLWGRNLV